LTGKSVLGEGGEVAESISYTYDNRGNLVLESSSLHGDKTYQYDSANRMILGVAENGESSSYTCNALGFLVGQNGQDVVVDYASAYQRKSLPIQYLRIELSGGGSAEIKRTVDDNHKAIKERLYCLFDLPGAISEKWGGNGSRIAVACQTTLPNAPGLMPRKEGSSWERESHECQS
jgi:YD repeat-containing protein